MPLSVIGGRQDFLHEETGGTMTTGSLVLNFHTRDFISLIIFPVTSSRVKENPRQIKGKFHESLRVTQPHDLTATQTFP